MIALMGVQTFPTLDCRAPRRQLPVDAGAFHESMLPDGTLWTSFYRIGRDYLLRFPDLADFVVSASGTEVTAYPAPGISRPTVEHLHLNQVVPLALSRRWKLVLHASAVAIEDFAVVFLGISGRGKSTLAASFSTSGYRFLTDDGLLVDKGEEGYIVHPGHASIRLWNDSREALVPDSTQAAPPLDYTPKTRLLADGEVAFCDTSLPLRCMYLLGEGNAVVVAPLSGRDAMIELVRHSFLLDIDEREMLSHQFAQLSALVDVPMFFRLDYPRRYEVLPQVRDVVIRHAAEPGPPKPP